MRRQVLRSRGLARSFPALLLAAALIPALSGCQANREVEQEMLNLKNDSVLQLGLLKRHNDYLVNKVNKVGERVGDLMASNDRLSVELARYVNRPDQVKREILAEVESRFATMNEDHVLFASEIEDRIDRRSLRLEDQLGGVLAAMTDSLDHHAGFLKFVFSSQDSVNNVFAYRFDARPWYQSVIGKWEERKRSGPQAQ